jgi:hypothetical protein
VVDAPVVDPPPVDPLLVDPVLVGPVLVGPPPLLVDPPVEVEALPVDIPPVAPELDDVVVSPLVACASGWLAQPTATAIEARRHAKRNVEKRMASPSVWRRTIIDVAAGARTEQGPRHHTAPVRRAKARGYDSGATWHVTPRVSRATSEVHVKNAARTCIENG